MILQAINLFHSIENREADWPSSQPLEPERFEGLFADAKCDTDLVLARKPLSFVKRNEVEMM